MYDVAVIGAGPVGSRVAALLSEAGYRVVVLDKKPSPGGPVCCTGIIGRECADSLSLQKELIFRQANSARLFSPSGKVVRVWRPEPQAMIVDRPAFNVLMAERAGRKGAEFRWDTTVTGIELTGNQAYVKISGGAGLPVRAAVVASGFASKIQGIPGDVSGRDFIMGAQAEVETKEAGEVEVFFGDNFAPGFFAWLAPTAEGRALVGLLSRRRPVYFLKKLLDDLKSRGVVVSSDAAMTHGGVPLQPLDKTYGDRVVVVGTAAGQVKPTTGGGIYYGLLCAEIAAKHVAKGLENGNLSSRSLAAYQREWHKLLNKELRTGYWARQMYDRLNDRQIDYIFDIITKTGIDKSVLEAADFSFDWHAKIVTRLLADGAVTRALMLMKIPFLRENGNVVYNNEPERR